MPGRPEKTRSELARRLANDATRNTKDDEPGKFFRDDDKDDYEDVGGRESIDIDVARELMERGYVVNIEKGEYSFARTLEVLRDASRGVKKPKDEKAADKDEKKDEKAAEKSAAKDEKSAAKEEPKKEEPKPVAKTTPTSTPAKSTTTYRR